MLKRLVCPHSMPYLGRMSELTVGGVIPRWSQGDRLRKAREGVELDQAELARELGVSRNTVNNYERARVTPRRPVLIVWALRCGVPLSWLELGDDGRLW